MLNELLRVPIKTVFQEDEGNEHIFNVVQTFIANTRMFSTLATTSHFNPSCMRQPLALICALGYMLRIVSILARFIFIRKKSLIFKESYNSV